MEKKDPELTQEAAKRLEQVCGRIGIESPLILTEKEDSSQPHNDPNKEKGGEAKFASPKSGGGLSEETRQRLLELYKMTQVGESGLNLEPIYENKGIAGETGAHITGYQIMEEEKTMERTEVKDTILRAKGRVNENSTKQERFTEPKKKMLLTRLIHRIGYNQGVFDDLEDAYLDGKINREDVEKSKKSEKWLDRSLYRRVQRYEDVVEDISVKNGWNAFKIGLVTALLAGTLALSTVANREYNAWKEDIYRVVTVDNAKENELLEAQRLLLISTEGCEYEFEHLTDKEMLDAAIRVPLVERKKTENMYKAAGHRFEDQEFLEKILKEAYGEDFDKFSPEQIRELKQLAYEFLSENKEKQQYIRDPQIVEQIKEKQKEEREIGE